MYVDGEIGRDTGGITRELWRLLGQSILQLYFGDSSKLVFRHDSECVIVNYSQEDLYCTVLPTLDSSAGNVLNFDFT